MRWNVTKFSGALLSTILAVSAWPSSPIAAPAPQTPANEFREVDVALVLAIDMSGSIDYQEADLQRRGIADALMNKEVIAAIQSGSLGRIGISAVYFSSRQYGVMSVPVTTALCAAVCSVPGSVCAQTMAASAARKNSTHSPAHATMMRRHFDASPRLAVAST